MNNIEVLKQALEALEKVKANADEWQERTGKEIKGWMQPVNDSITSLRQAIAEAEKQEPYCWTWDEFVSGGKWRAEYGWQKPTSKVTNLQALYTSPPQRQPLPMEQIVQFTYDIDEDRPATMAELFRFARAIEAAHGIKGEA